MKFIGVLVFAGALGFLGWQRFMKPAPPPPAPPPPPPAILMEPAPVISEEQLQRVLKSAEDPEANVRWEAVVFLDKVRSPHAMTVMQQMLRQDQDAQLRMRIIDMLAKRREPEALRALVFALRDMEPEVRVAALRALETIGDFTVASAIAEGPLRDTDEQVRLQAMKVLNSLQDKRQREIDAARQRYEQEKQQAAMQQQKKK